MTTSHTNKPHASVFLCSRSSSHAFKFNDVVMGNGRAINGTPWERNAYELLRTQSGGPGIDPQRGEGNRKRPRARGKCAVSLGPNHLPRKTVITVIGEGERGRGETQGGRNGMEERT